MPLEATLRFLARQMVFTRSRLLRDGDVGRLLQPLLSDGEGKRSAKVSQLGVCGARADTCPRPTGNVPLPLSLGEIGWSQMPEAALQAFPGIFHARCGLPFACSVVDMSGVDFANGNRLIPGP
jgi:hypothetical protein